MAALTPTITDIDFPFEQVAKWCKVVSGKHPQAKVEALTTHIEKETAQIMSDHQEVTGETIKYSPMIYKETAKEIVWQFRRIQQPEPAITSIDSLIYQRLVAAVEKNLQWQTASDCKIESFKITFHTDVRLNGFVRKHDDNLEDYDGQGFTESEDPYTTHVHVTDLAPTIARYICESMSIRFNLWYDFNTPTMINKPTQPTDTPRKKELRKEIHRLQKKLNKLEEELEYLDSLDRCDQSNDSDYDD